MIFATIGIVVLVISFVVALVTLIKEQNAIDSTSVAEPVEDKHTNAASSGNVEAQPEPLPAHKVDEGLGNAHEEEAPGVSSVHVTADAPLQSASGDLGSTASSGMLEVKPHVWWEQLDEDASKPDESNEDQESIEKIRAELAKLMSVKNNVESALEENGDDGLIVENPRKPTQGGLAASTLAGEFSLRGIKKKD